MSIIGTQQEFTIKMMTEVELFICSLVKQMNVEHFCWHNATCVM